MHILETRVFPLYLSLSHTHTRQHLISTLKKQHLRGGLQNDCVRSTRVRAGDVLLTAEYSEVIDVETNENRDKLQLSPKKWGVGVKKGNSHPDRSGVQR